MFSKTSTFGWDAPGAQALAAIALTAMALTPIYLVGARPEIFTLLLTPLIMALAFQAPIFIYIAFILFSTFRVHDAYPMLADLRMPLVLAGAALFSMLVQMLSAPARGRSSLREVKILAIAFPAVAIVFGFISPTAGGALDGGGGALLAAPLAVAGCLAMIVWYHFIQTTAAVPLPREMGVFVVFFCVVTAGLIVSDSRTSSVAYWVDQYWKIAAMTLAIAWLARRTTDFSLINSGLTIGGVAIAVVAIYNRINGLSLVEGSRVTIGRNHVEEGEPLSVLGDPNDLALVLLFPLSFAIASAIHRAPRPSSAAAALAAIVILAGILLTQSRGGLLGIIAVGGAFGLMMVRNKAILIAGVVVAAPALFIAMGIADRASGGAEELQTGLDASSSIRLIAWEAAVNMAISQPLTGVGLNAFVDWFFHYAPTWPGRAYAAHSTWFSVLGQTGVVGLGLFAFMVYYAVRSGLSSRQSLKTMKRAPLSLRISADAVVAGLAGFCVSGSFLSQGFNWPVYIFVAIAAALARAVQLQLEDASSAGRAPTERGR